MADFSGQIIDSTVLQETPTSNAFYSVDTSPTPIPPTYAQRVWSTGLLTWCYYTGILNPTPTSLETTPNWTGSITDYCVISERLN